MRLMRAFARGGQTRFLLTILVGWCALRSFYLWPVAASAPAQPRATIGDAPSDLLAGFATSPAAIFTPFDPARGPWRISPPGPLAPAAARSRPTRLMIAASDAGGAAEPAPRRAVVPFGAPLGETARAPAIPAPAPLFPQQQPSHGRAIEAQAYLFVRPGGGAASLAEHGELGGSQIAARIAVPIAPRFSAAARLYAPLRHGGAEAAVGIDWHPLAEVPLRISVERRQRLDAQGRSAFAAYAAGGFYRGGGPGTAQLDGYAQAGVVGARRADGFVDGALRLGYRLPGRSLPVTVGAGLWGAAQPGVSRLDAGPRVAMTLSIDRHSLSLAAEGRLRLAGRAAPGSGAALTLAADF